MNTIKDIETKLQEAIPAFTPETMGLLREYIEAVHLNIYKKNVSAIENDDKLSLLIADITSRQLQ